MWIQAILHFKKFLTEFNEIIITFVDQNGRSFEIEDKVNFTMLIIEYK